MKKWLLIIFSAILLVGCNDVKEIQPSDINNHSSVSLLDYFPTSQLEKSFLGKGNEFAQYTETFYENTDNYYPSIVNNGGTRILRVYKVTEDEITIVYEQPEYYEETIPSISSLEPNFISKPLLATPIKFSKKVGDWKVISLSETVTVPYGEYANVILLEMLNEDGSINRQYWAPKLGKIKDEFIQNGEDGTTYEVTSELQSVQ
ncbi:hypothetical protein [Pseudoneobacillus sp. C159]